MTLAGGTGTATWEALDADPAALESYTFGLVVGYATPQLGTASVTGELGPLSTTTAADSTSPVPRFADVSGDAAACAASPCLTATPSAIAISYQTGSAVPAPISVQLASTGSALQYNIAVQATTSGWLAVSPSSGGATPSTLQVNITPGNLAAGVYQGSIILTSPTSAFAAVTIPVSVGVTVGPSGIRPLVCLAQNASVTPTMRFEDITDTTGDIMLQCSDGTPTPAGVAVPAYDVQLTLVAPITSRTYNNGWSEALLMIDEPNSGLWGASDALLACNDPSGTCVVTGTGTGVNTYSGAAGRPNVFPGRVSENTVTFPGIPIDPVGSGKGGVVWPGTAANVRILRITNIRADATGLALSSTGYVPPLGGTVSAGVVAVESPMIFVGYVVPGLAVSVRTPDDSAASSGATISQCPSSAPQQAGVLRFSSQFGIAFRQRTIAPYVDSETSATPQPQNIPGTARQHGHRKHVLRSVADLTGRRLCHSGARQHRHAIARPPRQYSRRHASLCQHFASDVLGRHSSRGNQRSNRKAWCRTRCCHSCRSPQPPRSMEFPPWNSRRSMARPPQFGNYCFRIPLSIKTSISWSGSNPSRIPPRLQPLLALTHPRRPAFPDSNAHSASSILPIPRFAETGTAQNLFSITGCPAISPAPDLVVTSLTGPTNASGGATINASTTVLNQGAVGAGPFRVEFYFSPATDVSPGSAIDTTAGCSIASLAPGASSTCSASVTVPASLTSGAWYLAVLADSNNQVVELDETNNWRISDSGPVAVGPGACTISPHLDHRESARHRHVHSGDLPRPHPARVRILSGGAADLYRDAKPLPAGRGRPHPQTRHLFRSPREPAVAALAPSALRC